ncbi:oxygen-independent coproporphyrinogen III oxidase [Bradyrhizobium sp. WBOS7]|uniref:Coproporphyrinogen-III oxidase n=1 Tax=Bradyrhizobium betae TaxID=244734 RepID=A0AAE9SR10_9BRAD|nr:MULTISPECIES: oxygen-independent coproporphyrinogen III oxidase [Bradyrhizobium]MDD1571068.1 oxygen-independent coproporphyrinogen III oxidase [Bradyrhizobium sp. WBOS1]UUO35314.1 oxygen-independent coproporphyrinogen III oxidase [Bradyrhizobium sp. WBOS01]MDD1527719.1 oxygen-independent coproporphyrinogen III oxidase [Bradyrhizobium sp. WBOS2]MDD1577708.1 oxygen-independent coproporphyrinogen III oxidase [Bradyrhizobium sp. WBOS7]MDD1600654.1 oxygen-independent coproporphyrinogen III oxida
MRSDLAASYGEERLPRYTSYPTAPHFSTAIGPDTYARWLAELPAGASASLYLHVPFCREMCWYCGCHTQIARRDELIAGYQRTLRNEIAQIAETIGRRIKVEHIHFGGGTPTIMAPEAFVELMATMRQKFFVLPSAEIAVEIDPRTLTADMVEAMRLSGVNRASLGVQSFDPVVQRAINRVQSFEQTASVVDMLRRAGIAGINFDLIYGLPHQTVASCLDTVRRSLALAPDRLSVFGYAHVPQFKKHQRMINEAVLPDGLARHDQACAIANALKEAGYVQIGLDHFARPGDAMAVAFEEGTLRRNFQGYTTDKSEVLLGFGASAIGHLPQGYVQNEVQIGAYAQSIVAGRPATAKGYMLTEDDRLRADIIERIMCEFSADLGDICARHGAEAATMLRSAARLSPLISDGVVRLEGNRLAVAKDSRFLVRSVAAAFDAHLNPAKQLHSRAV